MRILDSDEWIPS